MNFNVEKKTRWILSGIILTAVLGYIFASFGKTEWVLWTFAFLGFLLGLGIFSEVGIISYFRAKSYKNIGFDDFFVWVGAGVGTVVIVNSLTIITAIRNGTPEWLLNFLSINGAIFGGIAGILTLIFLFTAKPR